MYGNYSSSFYSTVNVSNTHTLTNSHLVEKCKHSQKKEKIMALKFRQNLSFVSESVETTQLELIPATCTTKIKTDKHGKAQLVKTYKTAKNAKVEVISVTLLASERGQQLVFRYTNGLELTQDVAFFTLLIDGKIIWDTKPLFTQAKALTYKPVNSNFSPIEGDDLEEIFSKWLTSEAFSQQVTILSDTGIYTPALVKLLFLFIAYQEGRYYKCVELGGYSKTMEIDLDRVVVIFKEYISGLSEDFSVHLKKHYNVSQFTLSAAATPPIESIQVTPSTPDV